MFRCVAAAAANVEKGSLIFFLFFFGDRSEMRKVLEIEKFKNHQLWNFHSRKMNFQLILKSLKRSSLVAALKSFFFI